MRADRIDPALIGCRHCAPLHADARPRANIGSAKLGSIRRRFTFTICAVYEAWIDSVLPAPLTGPVEVTKDRPWSLVARVPTESGLLWFKENRAGTQYEAGLMEALWRWAPDSVLRPVAVQRERGWSLLPDGGPTIRE